MSLAACRGCGAALRTVMVDLGRQPLANSYLTASHLSIAEARYPLRAMVCDACFLVQLDAVADPEAIFSDYAYFSSYSDSWLTHARRYCDLVVDRFGLDAGSQVVEVASNDGYLLRNFVARGIPSLGIEPAANVVAAARAAGVQTRMSFFDAATARQLVAEGIGADLLVANNVLAHVPNLHDLVEGFRLLLRPSGIATFEFPHLLRLVQERQFDTIYHEHCSYFSLLAIRPVLERHAFSIVDVETLATHGGSLRLFVQHAAGAQETSRRVADLEALEEAAGLRSIATYTAFGEQAAQVSDDLRRFLIAARSAGKRVAAYGAPAKGNTLLNYCGIDASLVAMTVDRNPHKQHRYLPGSHIPVHAPEALQAFQPDYLLILPWNLQDEIETQMAWIGAWGGQFVVPIPAVTVWPAEKVSA